MRFTVQCSLVVALCAGMLMSVLSCCKNPTRHESPTYMLYASAIQTGGKTFVFAIDTETDSVVDSIEFAEDATFLVLTASPDGRYLSVWGGMPCQRIYDPGNLSLITELTDSDCRLQAAFVPKHGLIFASGRTGTKLLDYESFSQLASDTFGVYFSQVLSGGDKVCGITHFMDSLGGHLDSTGFLIYDCRSRAIERRWTRFRRPDGGSYGYIHHYDVHPNRQWVYAICNPDTRPGARLVAYDLLGDSALFEIPLCSYYGLVQVSPSGREVYLTDPGHQWWECPEAKIWIYDADNGALIHKIPLEGLDTTKPIVLPLYAYEIRFHPVKPKAYVACGGMKSTGPILVVDTEKREIIKWIHSSFSYVHEYIDIGPKPQSGR